MPLGFAQPKRFLSFAFERGRTKCPNNLFDGARLRLDVNRSASIAKTYPPSMRGRIGMQVADENIRSILCHASQLVADQLAFAQA